jgi:hypothetical protein
MTIDLSKVPTADLRREVNKRLAAANPKPKVLVPCVGCKTALSSVERRKPCPQCGARNPR